MITLLRSVAHFIAWSTSALAIHTLGKTYDFILYVRYLRWRLGRAFGFYREQVIPGTQTFMPRVCVMSMFQPKGLTDGFRFLLRSVHRLGYSIVLVSNAPIAEADIEFLKSYCVEIAIRPNVGRDFGGYQFGILRLLSNMDQLEELLLCNDSVLGPLHDLKAVHDRMEKEGADFWGMNDNCDGIYHIASYYLVLKPSVLRHRVFRRFWTSYKPKSSRRHSIYQGEIGFSKALLRAGLRGGVAFPVRDIVREIQTMSVQQICQVLQFLGPELLPDVDEFIDRISTMNDKGLLDLSDAREEPCLSMVRSMASNFLGSTLEKMSPVHIGCILFNNLIHYPFFKKDVVLRLDFSLAVVLEHLDITTDYPRNDIAYQLRAKGFDRGMPYIDRLLMRRGYM